MAQRRVYQQLRIYAYNSVPPFPTLLHVQKQVVAGPGVHIYTPRCLWCSFWLGMLFVWGEGTWQRDETNRKEPPSLVIQG